MKSVFKKNQVIMYVIALMLVVAGYLNFTSLNQTQQTGAIAENNSNEIELNSQIADVGDATLVNSNDVVTENKDEKLNNNEELKNEQDDLEVQQTNSSVNNDEYFAKSKLERETMYSQMLETYNKVLNSENSLETQKQSATQEITKINETKNSIMICENLIKTKGFENNIIFVNGESISVIIGAEELKQEEIAQIQNIISRELKAQIENIHIATK